MRTKSELKSFALDLRAEIRQTANEPFDGRALARLYGVPVIAISDVPCDPAVRQHFLVDAPERLSGALVPLGDGAIILENDAHPPERRLSTLAHELAHLTLEHEFSDTVFTDRRKCSSFARDMETEASELGGELLVPSSAAFALARRGRDDDSVACQFEVSIDMARWRMNATGARIAALNRRRAYERTRGRG